MQNINSRKILLFLSLTFIVNCSMVLIFKLAGGQLNSISGMIMTFFYMFIPMIAVVIVQKIIYKESLKKLDISFKLNKWFLAAWLLPPLMAFGVMGASLLFPSVEYSSGMLGLLETYKEILPPEQMERVEEQFANQGALPFPPVILALFQGLIAGVTINAIAGFGEELGWRGFLQKELSGIGFWRSSLLIGFIWGLWHAPLIIQGYNFPQHPVLGIAMMTAACTFLGVIFSYVTVKAYSVIAASIIHGSFNGTIGLSFILIKGGSDLITGSFGLAAIIVFGLISLILYFLANNFSLFAIKE